MEPAEQTLRVELAFSPAPRRVELCALELPAGSSVRDAVVASGVIERHGLALSMLGCAVWGRRRAWDALLADGDRVDVCRALLLDPMEARRARQRAQRLARQDPTKQSARQEPGADRAVRKGPEE